VTVTVVSTSSLNNVYVDALYAPLSAGTLD